MTLMQSLLGIPPGRVTVNLTISSNTQNYNIFSNKGGSYSAGKTDVILTINAGIVVGSASTASYALDTGTGWTSGDTIKIINNGSIVGAGGTGGNSDGFNRYNGASGGTALKLQYATQIQNNSVIGGGGGGGCGGGGNNAYGYAYYGVGGGGGAGNNVGSGGTGTGGNYGNANGASGSATNGGNGGFADNTGGYGGSAGVAGQNTGYIVVCDWDGCFPYAWNGGGGGGLGAAGGSSSAGYGMVAVSGGAAGAATNGAGTYATWLATGTRYGAIG